MSDSKLLRVANSSYSPPVIEASAFALFFLIACRAAASFSTISKFGLHSSLLLPRDIQLLRNIWRKRQRVNQRVSNSDQPHGIVDLREVAGLIARLPGPQHQALASSR